MSKIFSQINIISDYERLHIIPFLEHKKAETDEAVLTFAQDKDGTVYLLDCEHKKQEGEK